MGDAAMTALSDALASAQARAVAVLGKQYVAGTLSEEELSGKLDGIGLSDAVDIARWSASLAIIREGGGSAPDEAKATNGSEQPATEKQLHLILDLCARKNVSPPEFDGMTKAQASEAIDQLQRV